LSNTTNSEAVNGGVAPLGPNSYRCDLALVKEDDGTYTAHVLNLPGADTCGDTESEAIDNAKESVAALVDSYTSAGKQVPWTDPARSGIPEGAQRKQVLVNV